MAGALTSITQYSGPIQFYAHGTYTQPADDNANVHVHVGFVPKFVYVSADPLAAVGVAQGIHLYDMAAADSTNVNDGTDLATGVTLRNNWQVTTGEYYLRNGESNLSAAGDDDYITGFTLGDELSAGNAAVCYYFAIG